MEPHGTLGLENLAMANPQKTRRRQTKNKENKQNKTLDNTTKSASEQRILPRDEERNAWCPPAVPSYVPLPIPPLGSETRSPSNHIELASPHVARKSLDHSTPERHGSDDSSQSTPKHQPGPGLTTVNASPHKYTIPALRASNSKNTSSNIMTKVDGKSVKEFAAQQSRLHTTIRRPIDAGKAQRKSQQLPAPPKPQARSQREATPSAARSPEPYNPDPRLCLPVPTPSPTYLELASIRPTLLPHSQPLLLVLDLNGTLLVRNKNTGTGYAPRPHLKSFFKYAFANHSVLIWSSAAPFNVRGVCDRIFNPSQRKRLLGQWGRDTLDLTPAQYKAHVKVYKRLERIWNDNEIQSFHPGFGKGGKWGQHNTLLLDDSVFKASAQPFNHVEVPEFVKSREAKDGKDGVLAQVTGYLEEARRWSDVSAFVKGRKFEINDGWVWKWQRYDKNAGKQTTDDDNDEDDDDGGGVSL